MFCIERSHFENLFKVLKQKGFVTYGPTVKNGAIVFDEIQSTKDLPIGWTDEQDAGTYRLKKRPDKALFGYVVGPTSWKKFLFPPKLKLWQAKAGQGDFEIANNNEAIPKHAFIGVRPCELKAIAVQDKIFLQGPSIDPSYKARREQALLIAVNCGQAASTCFCTSMNTGPRASEGFDLSLTEIIEGGNHYFVVEVGTEKGEEILKEIPHKAAEPAHLEASEKATEKAVSQISRKMDAAKVKELLYNNLDPSNWDTIAERCLACGNCTLVCPTCFCSTVEDVTDLAGEKAERWRVWDSCFTKNFSYIHGGHIRRTIKSRYRQWITHKLASWHDQFGTSGCVGCGRCITWCPVGIDITERVQAVKSQAKGEIK